MLVCFPKERVTRWEKRSNGRKRTPGRTQASRCGRRRACEGEAVVKKGVWRDGTSAWGAAVESGSRGPDAEPSGGSVTLEATGWGDKEPEASLRGTASAGARWGWARRKCTARASHGEGPVSLSQRARTDRPPLNGRRNARNNAHTHEIRLAWKPLKKMPYLSGNQSTETNDKITIFHLSIQPTLNDNIQCWSEGKGNTQKHRGNIN